MTSADVRLDSGAVLLLTHIPKCAGTSFRHSLVYPNVPAELIYQPVNGLWDLVRNTRDFQYLSGHFEPNVEMLFRGPVRKRRRIHVTFLRDPVDRAVSFYCYKKQQSLGDRVERVSGEEIVGFYQKNRRFRNMQARFLSGLLINRFAQRLTLPKLDVIQLRLAKKNLLEKYHFVGQFEELDRDMRALADLLSIRYCPVFADETKTRVRPSVGDLSVEEAVALERLNCLDVELYRFADVHFWAQRQACESSRKPTD